MNDATSGPPQLRGCQRKSAAGSRAAQTGESVVGGASAQ